MIFGEQTFMADGMPASHFFVTPCDLEKQFHFQ